MERVNLRAFDKSLNWIHSMLNSYCLKTIVAILNARPRENTEEANRIFLYPTNESETRITREVIARAAINGVNCSKLVNTLNFYFKIKN